MRLKRNSAGSLSLNDCYYVQTPAAMQSIRPIIQRGVTVDFNGRSHGVNETILFYNLIRVKGQNWSIYGVRLKSYSCRATEYLNRYVLQTISN